MRDAGLSVRVVLNDPVLGHAALDDTSLEGAAVGGAALKGTALAAGTPRLRHGDPGMRQVRLGLFAAGLATFALLYTPQPLLPMLATSFGAAPAAASLAMSAGTGALAVAIIPVSSLSEVFGRRRVMAISLLAAAALGLIAPLAPSLGA